MILSAIYSQTNVHLAPGPEGDALVFWNDQRTLSYDIRGSRVTPAGGVQSRVTIARAQ